jgi:hypothetical protein
MQGVHQVTSFIELQDIDLTIWHEIRRFSLQSHYEKVRDFAGSAQKIFNLMQCNREQILRNKRNKSATIKVTKRIIYVL